MQNIVSLSLIFPINTEARLHRLRCHGVPIISCCHRSIAGPHAFASQSSFSCINLHALLYSITSLLIVLGLLRDFWFFIDRINYFFVVILEGH